MFRFFLSFLIAFLFLCHSHAQNGKLYNADKHLPSSFINQVFLDHDGFIWTATRSGLCKYDGYQFNIYKKERNNDMANSFVNCIYQDSIGLFYLGYFSGFQTFDGTSFKNVHVKDLKGKNISCYATCFAQKQGKIYAGTSEYGIIMFDSPDKAHQLGEDFSKIVTVQRILVDKKNQMWILTDQQGLMLYQDGKLIQTFFEEEPVRSSLRRICEDKLGNVYVGTAGQGVFKLENGIFRRIEELDKKPIMELFCINDGRIAIGYNGGGIGIYDPHSGSLINNPYHNFELDLSKTKVASITQDRSGNLWLGMLQKGLYMHPVSSGKFEYMGYKNGEQNLLGQACVTSTFIDSRGYCWVGTDMDGLYCFDPSHQLVKHFKEGFPAVIMSITEDERGDIWIGCYTAGCGKINPKTLSYTPIQLMKGQKISVFGMTADKRGNIWIGTMGLGVIKMSTNNGKKTIYKLQKGGDTNRKINCLANDYISKLSVSEDGKRLYVATTTGVSCLDIEKDNWVNTFGANCLLYGTPIRVAKEYNHILWIGTYKGLYTYHLKTHKSKLLTMKDGLCDNGIASIEQDKNGVLWIGTDHGLSSYRTDIDQIESFYADNGLQSNEFSDDASFCTTTGQLYFGGVGGITWFNPQDISMKKWNASVKLTALLINSEPVNKQTKSGGYQVCDSDVRYCRHFELSYEDNSFSIQLSTLTFDVPELITYYYSLNDEPYLKLRPGLNEILFTHLQPGRYRLRVKAKYNNQETAEESYVIIIHAPWYRSGWAYTLYFLIIVCGCILFWYYRRKNKLNKLKMQEYIHAEEKSEEKLRFFMNISHEIRTPMTLILTPLLSLIRNDRDPLRHSAYETMKRSADRILHLVNQMMDLRKIDKGQMTLKMCETDLVDFIKDIFRMFDIQAKNNSITFNLVSDTKQLPVWIDRENFDKVIVNILSNAFKFTPSGGHISIRISNDLQQARVAISNDGQHIPEDQLEKIFERFYQSDSVSNIRTSGTGIGLDLARSLVELHSGNIYARNTKEGCEFVISIPLGNKHLKPDEMVLPDDNREEKMPSVDIDIADVNEVTKSDSLNQKPTVVVAEDDDDIRTFLKKELNEEYNVITCNNGKEALMKTYQTMPALVISDIMMPEMRGDDLCLKLKNNMQTNHIPVILLTAKNLDEDKLVGLDTGADAYIVKPFNMSILRHTIINLIHSRQILKTKYGQTEHVEKAVADIIVESPDEKLMKRMTDSINKHLNNPGLSVDTIAQEIGISRGHLHLKVKELTGQTPHGLIRSIRLKKAANLLSSQKMSIAEVVYACGFQNVASFSTMFKNVYGMSPREYNKNSASSSS